MLDGDFLVPLGLFFIFIIAIVTTTIYGRNTYQNYDSRCVSMGYTMFNGQEGKCQKFNSGGVLEKEVIVNFSVK